VNMRHLFTSALADATKSTYASGFRQYCNFCTLQTIRHNPFQPDEGVFCLFVTYCYLKPSINAFSTIKSYLSATRSAYLDNGLPPVPFDRWFLLERILRGTKRLMGGKATIKRRPITVAFLRTIRRHFDMTSIRDRTIWCMAVIAVFGLLRCGEFTAKAASSQTFPLRNQLSMLSRTRCSLFLPASKTDVFRKGTSIHYARNGTDIDPTVLFHQLLVDHHEGDVGTKPLFPEADGRPITRASFLLRMDTAIADAGFDSAEFMGHSYRKGGAQSLADAGASVTDIKTMGRWASWCFELYINMTQERFSFLSAVMARQPETHRLG
jgi:hypothetical protein